MCADADVQKMQENRKKREDMCMQKNDTVVVEITDIGVNGEGIAVSYTHLTLPTNSRV